MAATITEEVERVWVCRLFSWTEEGEARGIEAQWSPLPLVMGRYVELKGMISVEKLPVPVLIDIEAKIDREQKFLNWVGLGSPAADKEEWMHAYPGKRLSNFLKVEFAVKEADIFRDDLIYSIGNVGGGSDVRIGQLIFIGADENQRSLYDRLSLEQRFERGIIFLRSMIDESTGNLTGLELSTVWRISGGGESITKPEYFFDVGLQYKYEGPGEIIGELLEGGAEPQESTTYSFLGRSVESDAGPIEFECHLAFYYWNPIQNKHMSVPEGIEVRVIDYDPLSANDVIGRGKTGNEGKVNINIINKDEDNPDVFFELLTNGNCIELETNQLVDKNSLRAEKHYQILPQKWSSKDKYSTDYLIGFFDDFQNDSIGSAMFPLTFPLTLDCFIQLVYWNEIHQRYTGLPEGIEVEVMDYDPEANLGIPIVGPIISLLTSDDRIGSGYTDRDGKVHLRIFYKDELNPDIYFRYRVPDDKPNRIDLRSNKLIGESIPEREIQLTSSGPAVIERPIGTKMPRAENGTLPIPRKWSTYQRKYVQEDPTRKGYWDDYVGYRIGIPDNPYVFDIFQDMPRWIAGNKVDYLIDGNNALPRIIQAIENAERSIHVEVMLFFNDEIGNMLKDLLIHKAREGVEVRLLFDKDTTAGSYNLIMFKKFWVNQLLIMDRQRKNEILSKLDAEIAAEKIRGDTTEMRRELKATQNLSYLDSSFPYVGVLPSAPSGTPELYRDIEGRLPFFTLARIDHRKMIVIDGKIVLLGGMNVGREYLYHNPFNPSLDAEEEAMASAERWTKWHDCFCEIRGPAVREMQKIFRERWVTEGGDEFPMGPHSLGVGTDTKHPYFPQVEPEPENISMKIVTTTPGARFHIHEEYLTMIDNAQEEIYIENPYLSSIEFKQHLIKAAERGVRVHYIFPDEHNDSLDFLYSARIKYEDFLKAGVNVYEYRNHMTHAKVAAIDNDITVIGSANLNHSSMYNHYECNVFIQSEAFASNFKRDFFKRDIANSRSISQRDLDELIQLYPLAYAHLLLLVNVMF